MSYFKAEDWDDNTALSQGIERAKQKTIAVLKNTRWERATRAYLYMHCVHDMRALQQVTTEVGREYSLDSALFLPLFLTQVLAAKPRLKDSLLGADPPWKVNIDPDSLYAPSGESVEDVDCERYQNYLAWQLQKHIGWRGLIDPLLMDSIPYGIGIVKLDWYRRWAKQWEMRPVPGTDGRHALMPKLAPQTDALRDVQDQQLAEDRIRAGLVSQFHWLPDMHGRSLRGKYDRQPCRYVGETGTAVIEELVEAIMTEPLDGWQYPENDGKETLAKAQAVAKNPSDIESFKALKKDVEEWLAKFEGSALAEEDPIRALQAKVKKAGGSVDSDPEDKQLAAITHFYTAGSDPWYLVRLGGAGGDILKKLRGANHPCIFAPLPYVAFSGNKLAHELCGFGLIDILDYMQREDNAWANLILSTFRESMAGITLLNKSKGITIGDLLSQPNRMLEVTNPGGLPMGDLIHHIERPVPNIGAVLSMLDRIVHDAQTAAGGTDASLGSSSTSSPVRTTAMMVDQGGRRWGDESTNYVVAACEMGEMMDGFNKQYGVKDVHFRVPGMEGSAGIQRIGPTMMQRKYEILFSANPVVVDEKAALAAHTQFAATYMNTPEFNRSRAITDHAKLIHKSKPREFSVVHPQDAEHENFFFTETGTFPWQPRMHDDHMYHDEQHTKMVAWVQAAPPDIQPMLMQNLIAHLQGHAFFLGGAAAAGQQLPTPPQAPREGGPNGEQSASGRKAGGPAGAVPPLGDLMQRAAEGPPAPGSSEPLPGEPGA